MPGRVQNDCKDQNEKMLKTLHFAEILLIKSKKLTVFAKRYVVQSVCNGLKKPF